MTDLVKSLNDGTESIIAFLDTVNNEIAHKKSSPETWSIMEHMEHIFITEKGIYKLMLRPDLFSDKPSTGFDRLDEYNRGKFTAPDYTLPTGRFSSLEEIKNAFKILRGQLEEYVINELPKAGNETYPHPILGPITRSQWIEFAIGHGDRHLKQMKNLNVEPV